MADIFRGPLVVNRREVDPRLEVRHYVLPSLLTTVFVAVVAAPFTPNATASAPERPRYLNADTSRGTPKTLTADAQAPVFVAPQFAPNAAPKAGWLPADTSRGQPITLQTIVPPAPLVNAPWFVPQRYPWLPQDSSRGTPKPLYADAQLPFRTYHHTPPDATRPVTDTTRGTSLALLTFIAPPLPPGNSLILPVPPWPFSISDTTAESPPVAIQNVQPAPPADTTLPVAGGKHRRPRAFIEIDGELFPVSNEQEAIALLTRARELAAVTAEASANRALAKAVRKDGKVTVPRVKAPKIKLEYDVADAFVRHLQPQIAAAQTAIAVMYQQAAESARLAYLAEQDEEAAIIAILLD